MMRIACLGQPALRDSRCAGRSLVCKRRTQFSQPVTAHFGDANLELNLRHVLDRRSQHVYVLKPAASTTLWACAAVLGSETLPDITTEPFAWLRRMSSFGNSVRICESISERLART